MGLLEGKKAVIFGIANEKSIAWAIARAFAAEGAELAFTYAGETLERRVRPLAEELGVKLVLPCDVTSDDDIRNVFATLKQEWGGLDTLVHSVAFADKEELKGSFLNTSRKGFALAMDISAYSLVGLAKEAFPLMQGRDGSIITLTYYGAVKVFPNYNVMGVAKAALEACVRYLAASVGRDGIRVNGISAGPIKTLAAAGIGGFREIGKHVEEHAPLQRNVTQEDVAGAAVYLASRLASGVTGEIHYVDSGYNVVGM